jgi:hypothetical protein
MAGAFFVREDAEAAAMGTGPAVAATASGDWVVTLGLAMQMDQQSFDLQVEASEDGENWFSLLTFPQKLESGTYARIARPASESKWLRASWKAARWGRGVLEPRLRFWVAAEPVADI